MPQLMDVTSSSTFIGRVYIHATYGKPYKVNQEVLAKFGDLYDGSYVTPIMDVTHEYKVFNRYSTPACIFNGQIFAKACAWTRKRFLGSLRAPFATHEEVLANMDMSTSPGYPYNQFFPSKQAIIESYGVVWLEDAYEAFLANPYVGAWKQSLKTELRPRGKDPRGILSDSMDQVYIKSRFFLNQNKAFYDSAFKTPSVVGMSREHGEWDRMFRKLARHLLGGDIDYSQYDSRMLALTLLFVCSLRKEALLDHQKWAEPYMDVLYESIICSVIVMGYGDVWQKWGGNPSGSVNTTSDNTMPNDTLLNYAYITLNPTHTYEDMQEKVTHFLYGDDNTYTYDEDVDLAPEHVAEVVSCFGYKVTHGGVKKPEDLTFLSAGFKPEYFAPLKRTMMVPIFDRKKMVHHIVGGGQSNDATSVFERLCSLKRLLVFDEELARRIDEVLLDLKPHVPPSVWGDLFVSSAAAKVIYLAPRLRQ